MPSLGSATFVLRTNAASFHKGLAAAEAEASAATKKIGASFAAMGKGMGEVGSVMTRKLTLPIVALAGVAGHMSMTFEDSMSKIQALVGVSGKQVGEWGKQILELGKTLPQSPKELADALFFVTSAGFRGREAMDVLTASAKASAAGLGETKTVADAVTSAVNAYGIGNLSAAKATDIMIATVREGKMPAADLAGSLGKVIAPAEALGVSFDEVGAAIASMTRVGLNAHEATTALRGIMMAAVKPTKASAAALEAVHMSVDQLRTSIREKGLLNTLLDLRERTHGNVEMMAALFPNVRALNGVLIEVGRNAKANTEIQDHLAHSAGSLDKAFTTMSQTAEFKYKTAMNNLKIAMIEIGDKVVPILIPLFVKLGEKIGQLADFFRGLSPHMQKMIEIGVGIVAAAGPLLTVFSNIIRAVGLFGRALALLSASPIVLLFVGLGVAMYELYTRSSSVRGAIDGLKSSFGSFSAAISTVKRWLGDVIDFFRSEWGQRIAAAGVAIAAFSLGIRVAMTVARTAVLAFTRLWSMNPVMLGISLVVGAIGAILLPSLLAAREHARKMADAFREAAGASRELKAAIDNLKQANLNVAVAYAGVVSTLHSAQAAQADYNRYVRLGTQGTLAGKQAHDAATSAWLSHKQATLDLSRAQAEQAQSQAKANAQTRNALKPVLDFGAALGKSSGWTGLLSSRMPDATRAVYKFSLGLMGNVRSLEDNAKTAAQWGMLMQDAGQKAFRASYATAQMDPAARLAQRAIGLLTDAAGSYAQRLGMIPTRKQIVLEAKEMRPGLFQDTITAWIQAAKRSGIEIPKWISDAATPVGASTQKVVDAVGGKAGAARTAGQNVGSALGQGITFGISQHLGPAIAAATALVNGAVHAAFIAAGRPRSPAPATYWIGRSLAEGLEVGIGDGIPRVAAVLTRVQAMLTAVADKRAAEDRQAAIRSAEKALADARKSGKGIADARRALDRAREDVSLAATQVWLDKENALLQKRKDAWKKALDELKVVVEKKQEALKSAIGAWGSDVGKAFDAQTQAGLTHIEETLKEKFNLQAVVQTPTEALIARMQKHADRAALVAAVRQSATEVADLQRVAAETAASRFRAGGPAAGMTALGNLDILSRQAVKIKDMIATVRSASATFGNNEVLFPTAFGGRINSIAASIARYKRTGQNLGIFSSAAAADAYAERLHQQQAALGQGQGQLDAANKLLEQSQAAVVQAGLHGMAREAAMLDRRKAIWEAKLEALKAVVQTAQGRLTTALGSWGGDIVRVFDAQTSRGLREIEDKLRQKFNLEAAVQTPTEALIARMNAERSKASLDKAVADAQKQLNDAQTAASGGAPRSEAAILLAGMQEESAQASLDQAVKDAKATQDVAYKNLTLLANDKAAYDQAIRDADAKMNDALYNQTVARLQKTIAAENAKTAADQAITSAQEQLANAQREQMMAALEEVAKTERDAEVQRVKDARAAFDAELADAQLQYQAKRDLQKRHLEATLADLQESFAQGRTSTAQANVEMLALMRQYGVPMADAGALLGRAFATGLSQEQVAAATAAGALVRATAAQTAAETSLAGIIVQQAQAAVDLAMQAARVKQNAALAALDQARLTDRATAERTAEAARVVAATKAFNAALAQAQLQYQAQRDLQKTHLDAALTALEERLAKSGATADEAGAALTKLLKKYEVPMHDAGMLLGDAFARGLGEKEKDVERAAETLAGAAAKYLKLKSPAEAGPLSDLDVWWSPLGRTLASSVDVSAVEAIAGRLSRSLAGGGGPLARGGQGQDHGLHPGGPLVQVSGNLVVTDEVTADMVASRLSRKIHTARTVVA